MLRYAWALLHFVDRASTPSITGECQCSGILFLVNKLILFLIMSVVIIIVLIAVIIYLLGHNQFNQSRPLLSIKYPGLVNIIRDRYYYTQIYHDHNNNLIIGGKDQDGGNVIFHIKDNPDDNVLIIYEVKNSPLWCDFKRRYGATIEDCINKPDSVIDFIDTQIMNEIQDGKLIARIRI